MSIDLILPALAFGVAAFLTIGETLVLIKTDKYWPLSLDDYLVCGLLFYSALTFENYSSLIVMIVAWALMAGNLYAMLFTRLDPKTGTRERIPALAVLLVLAVLGLGLSVAKALNLGGVYV